MAIPFWGKKQIAGRQEDIRIEVSSTETGYLAVTYRVGDGSHVHSESSSNSEGLQSFLEHLQKEGSTTPLRRER